MIRRAAPLGPTAPLGLPREPDPSPPASPGAEAPLSVGLARAKVDTQPGLAAASQVAARDDELQRYRTGKEPLDAAAFAAVTGITVSPAEAARLDARVKDVARSIGLDHDVGFAAETKFLGRFFEYSFLGMFHGQDRERQPILVGVGALATAPEQIELLYKHFGAIDPRLRPMLDDLLRLDEGQRIQAILVHEKLELDAAKRGERNPHRAAVAEAPKTTLAIDPPVRRHLELYARLDREIGGPLR